MLITSDSGDFAGIKFPGGMEQVMRNRMGWLRLMFALMAVLTMALPHFAEASSGKKPKVGEAEGVLVSVIDTGVTIRTKAGDLVSVTVDATTKIELNEKHVQLSALTVGNLAEVKFDPVTLIASKIESEQ